MKILAFICVGAAALVALAFAGCQRIAVETAVIAPPIIEATPAPPTPVPMLVAAATPASTPPPAAAIAPRPITASAPAPERAAATVNTTAATAAPGPPAKPTPFAGFGNGSNILSAQPKGYNQRKAFVDTDGDGRKFDTHQPSRLR